MKRYPQGHAETGDKVHAYETDDPNFTRHGAAGWTKALCGVRVWRDYNLFVWKRPNACKRCTMKVIES